MTNSTPTPNPESQPTNNEENLPTPLRCLISALMAGGLATGCYFLTAAIAQNFASKPLPSANVTAMNIAIAVRTLVVGVASLATFVFGFVAVGLVAFAIQVSIKKLKNSQSSLTNTH